MKKEIKGFVFGVLTTVVVGSGAAIAAGQFTSIDVVPNNVRIALNGDYTDIPSFTYNDSTYVQLRPVLEGINCIVKWIPEQNTVNCYNRFYFTTPACLVNNMYSRYGQIGDLESEPAKVYVDTTMLLDAGLNFRPDMIDPNIAHGFYSAIARNNG